MCSIGLPSSGEVADVRRKQLSVSSAAGGTFSFFGFCSSSAEVRNLCICFTAGAFVPVVCSIDFPSTCEVADMRRKKLSVSSAAGGTSSLFGFCSSSAEVSNLCICFTAGAFVPVMCSIGLPSSGEVADVRRKQLSVSSAAGGTFSLFGLCSSSAEVSNLCICFTAGAFVPVMCSIGLPSSGEVADVRRKQLSVSSAAGGTFSLFGLCSSSAEVSNLCICFTAGAFVPVMCSIGLPSSCEVADVRYG